MKKLWVCLFVLGMVFGLGEVAARAQSNTSKIDVFLGYSFMTSDLADFNQNLNGYGFSIAANLNRHFAIEGDFSGHNGTLDLTNPSSGVAESQDQNDYYILFGPKAQINVGRVNLFAHFLVGPALLRFQDVNTVTGATIDSLKNAPFTAGIGGGADWNFGSGRFGWRILELDDLFSRTAGATSGQLNNLQLETGLVFHL